MNIFKSNSFEEEQMNKNGVTVFFALAIIPIAIVNILVAQAVVTMNSWAYLINGFVGCFLFFSVNRLTDRLYGFRYKVNAKALFYIFLQLMVAYVPAGIIILLLTTQTMAIALVLNHLIAMAA